MATDDVRDRFRHDGFVLLPRYLDPTELAAGTAALTRQFPTADEFHDDVARDPAAHARFRSEFGGIDPFPFAEVDLSLLAVHPRLVDLAEDLLGTANLRAYTSEAWAKYTGAADYDQPLHRDFLNHSLLVPDPDAPPSQVELFLYLTDVPVELGPPSIVPLTATADRPALPNWYPRAAGTVDEERPDWHSAEGHPELYAAEVPAAGPAGTVVAYRIETFHRGTALLAPRGMRATIHTSIRCAHHDWVGRRSWIDDADTDAFRRFVAAATPRQLALFGFPPPGHPYWTDRTRAGVAQRYPGLDVSPWA